MKRGLRRLLFLTLCFVGITSVNAAPFKIGVTEYDSLVDAVAAVPTDGTKTTIVMTEDYTGPGVEIDSGKNVVIDFGGHNYESAAPFVGSSKTKTISFRFMPGATVVLQNGNLKASNDINSKMFIQNYSNLTTKNIHIEAGDNNYNYFYAISNNLGKVYIGEGTSIHVNDKLEARSIDMCWWPSIGETKNEDGSYTAGPYGEGTQIVVETDDEINGYIELDYGNKSGDLKYSEIKSTLEIKNIDFHGKWTTNGPELFDYFVIDGGRYFNPGFSESQLPPASPTKENPYIDIRLYLKDGNASYNLDEHFYVLPSKMVAYDNEKLFIIKGNEYNFTKNLPTGYEKFVRYDIADKTIVSVENGILKGLKDGVTRVVVTLGETKNGAITKEFDAIVFDLDAATDYQANKNETGAIVNVMNVIVSNVIEKALDDNENESIDAETRDKLIAAIEDGKTVDAKIEVKTVKESDLDANLVNKIKNSVTNGTVVEFLDINLLLEADNQLLGKVTKLDEALELQVDAPASLGNVPAGTTRKFFVVRTHEGEEPEIIEATYRDGKIIFKTDKFSDYAVGYTDTTNPKTGDSIINYVVLLAVALTSLYLIRNKRNA